MSQLLQNAVYGGIMILAVAALRRGLKGRLVPEARLALWAVCLFRLLTPNPPTSALSLWVLFGREAQGMDAPVPAVTVPSGVGAAAPAAPNGVVPAAPTPAGTGIAWGTILGLAWAAMGIVLAARFALSYARTRRAVGRTILLGRDDPRYAALPKCARLREGPMDGAPLTFGVARPAVVLTPGLAGEELACVLAHEGVHARRRDNLWHYVTALALIVHWWNPAVWLMARLLRRDVELACDRAAVKRLGAEKRAEYANALISMATQGKDPAFCQTFGRKAAEERIISVMKYKKTTIAGAALTLALVLAVTVGFASNPAEPKADPAPGTTPTGAPELIPDADAGESPSLEEALAKYLDGIPSDKTDYVVYPGTPADEVRAMYKELLVRLVSEGSVTQAEANEMQAYLERVIAQVDRGEAESLTFNMAASGEFVSVSRGEIPVCTLEGCTVSGVHRHGGSTVVHHDSYNVCPVEGCTTPGYHTHNGDTVYRCNGSHCGGVCDGSCVLYFGVSNCPANGTPIGEQGLDYDTRVEDSAGAGDEPVACPPEAIDKTTPFGPHTCADCGVEGCTVDYLHMHSGIFTFTMGPVCPREDCGLWGCHEHDGVMYSCNGGNGTYHQNGVCDGSCYVHSTPIYYETNGIAAQGVGFSGQGYIYGYGYGEGISGGSHHSENHSSGHHGNGHH